MSLQFVENFYPYGATGSSLANANANFNTQWITHGSAAAVITTGFQAKAKALTLPRSGSTYAQVERRFTSTDDTVIVGYAFRATQRGAVTFSVRKDDVTPIVDLEWPNQFKIGSVTGTATILLNKVYYVELKIVKSTQTATLKVNGYDYLTTTFTETVPDTIQCFWGFPAAGTPAADFVFSNIYFADGAAGRFTDFVGPQKIISRAVTTSIDPGWAPEPSAKTRVQIMNNIPANSAEYTEADTVGVADMYTSSDDVDDTAIVNGVAVTSLLTKTDIDDQYVALQIKNGVDTKLGTDISVPIQPAYFQQMFETDAASTNWTPAVVEATAFGPVIRPRP